MNIIVNNEAVACQPQDVKIQTSSGKEYIICDFGDYIRLVDISQRAELKITPSATRIVISIKGASGYHAK